MSQVTRRQPFTIAAGTTLLPHQLLWQCVKELIAQAWQVFLLVLWRIKLLPGPELAKPLFTLMMPHYSLLQEMLSPIAAAGHAHFCRQVAR